MKLASYMTNGIYHIHNYAIVRHPFVVNPLSEVWVLIHAHDRGLAPVDRSLLSVFVRDDKLFLCA